MICKGTGKAASTRYTEGSNGGKIKLFHVLLTKFRQFTKPGTEVKQVMPQISLVKILPCSFLYCRIESSQVCSLVSAERILVFHLQSAGSQLLRKRNLRETKEKCSLFSYICRKTPTVLCYKRSYQVGNKKQS